MTTLFTIPAAITSIANKQNDDLSQVLVLHCVPKNIANIFD